MALPTADHMTTSEATGTCVSTQEWSPAPKTTNAASTVPTNADRECVECRMDASAAGCRLTGSWDARSVGRWLLVGRNGVVWERERGSCDWFGSERFSIQGTNKCWTYTGAHNRVEGWLELGNVWHIPPWVLSLFQAMLAQVQLVFD